MDQSNRNVQYFIGCAVFVASMYSGISFSWLTPVIPKFHNNESGVIYTDTELMWLVMSGSPGTFIGTLGAHYPCDHFGRRFTLLMSAAPYLVGAMFLLITTKHWLICITRLIWGMGLSIVQSVATIYITEVASKEIRGRLSVANRFMFNFGVFIVITVGSFVSYQTLNYILAVLPIIYFFICWWIPETPYYLLKKGKIDDARKVLMKLYGSMDDQILEQRLTDMRLHVKEDMRRSTSVFELFRGKRYRKALILGMGLRTFQVTSGTIPVQFYLGRILQETESSLSLTTGLITYGAIRFFVSMLSSTLVDKVGRRPLLICSFVGGFLLLFVVGICFIIQESIFIVDYPCLFGDVIFCELMCFTIISTVGYDTIVFLVMVECYPLNIKSIAMSCVQIFGSVATVIILVGYQHIKDLGGLQTVFLTFSTICLIGAIFSYCLVPETNGKSLREIQIYLQGSLYEECEEMANLTKTEDEKTVGITACN